MNNHYHWTFTQIAELSHSPQNNKFKNVTHISSHVQSRRLVLFFGKNPQAVAYPAQPLYWSGWETSFHHHTPGEQYGKMEPKYPEGGHRQGVLGPQGIFNVTLYL